MYCLIQYSLQHGSQRVLEIRNYLNPGSVNTENRIVHWQVLEASADNMSPKRVLWKYSSILSFHSLHRSWCAHFNLVPIFTFNQVVCIFLVVLSINSGLSSQLACNPDNRECSCADTSSRVSQTFFLNIRLLSNKGLLNNRQWSDITKAPYFNCSGLWRFPSVRKIPCGGWDRGMYGDLPG